MRRRKLNTQLKGSSGRDVAAPQPWTDESNVLEVPVKPLKINTVM